jgi:hypothetical protein
MHCFCKGALSLVFCYKENVQHQVSEMADEGRLGQRVNTMPVFNTDICTHISGHSKPLLRKHSISLLDSFSLAQFWGGNDLVF